MTLENAILKWFSNVREKKVPVRVWSYSARQSRRVSQKLEIENFKASTGWLERFKERNGITFKKVCGEAKSVDMTNTDMTEWGQRLSRILEQYSPDDIYNADETGMFYHLLPDKTLSCTRKLTVTAARRAKND